MAGIKQKFPAQTQHGQPGSEREMAPLPKVEGETIPTGRKRKDKVALITGGDSGRRAVSVAFAAEGADVAVIYLNEHQDAKETARLVEAKRRRCLLVPGDVGNHQFFCFKAVGRTLSEFRRLDVVVNNAAKHYPKRNFEDITPEQLEETLRTNVFSYFFITQAALPHFKGRRYNHQHRIGCSILRQSLNYGLFRHQGCDRCAHPDSFPISDQVWHPG